MREAKDQQIKISGIVEDALAALNDYIEGLPQEAGLRLKTEQEALKDVLETERKHANILNLMYILRCGE
jgi:hypothetical protein